MLLASPHAGFTLALRCVICFHSPIGPAQTSGAAANEFRITADVFPSCATERFVPQSPAETPSPPRQIVSTWPFTGSSVAIAESPSIHSPKSISPSAFHSSQLAEAFISGVKLLAPPPAAVTAKMSPPTESSSLISPSTNAIFSPSGNHVGRAVCRSASSLASRLPAYRVPRSTNCCRRCRAPPSPQTFFRPATSRTHRYTYRRERSAVPSRSPHPLPQAVARKTRP